MPPCVALRGQVNRPTLTSPIRFRFHGIIMGVRGGKCNRVNALFGKKERGDMGSASADALGNLTTTLDFPNVA